MSSSYSICAIALSSKSTSLSINLFFHPIRTFRHLSSFIYQLTYVCIFIFDSSLFSTSLLSHFQHWSFSLYFPESALWCLAFFCLPLPLSRILLSFLLSLQLDVRFLNILFHHRFIFCYIRRFHIYHSSCLKFFIFPFLLFTICQHNVFLITYPGYLNLSASYLLCFILLNHEFIRSKCYIRFKLYFQKLFFNI